MRNASDRGGLAAGVVFLLIFVGTAAAQYGGGTGTSDDPYQIRTAEQMNAIGARPGDWDKHFRLMADIDLGGYTGQQFRIIGRDRPGSVPFSGSFDGNGHRIHHFTYRSSSGNSVGLFGFIQTGLDSPPAVRNLGLVDPNVDVGKGEGAAALVGQIFNGTIRDCYVEGGRISGFASVGGLVGYTSPTNIGPLERDLVNCHTSCEVSGDSMVGGVAGAVSSQTRVLECRSFGTVSGRTHVGGLVGTSASGRIASCSTRAHVVGKSWTGGLVGSCTGGSEAVTACAAWGDVAGEEDTGGLVGWNIYGGITDSYAIAPVSGIARVGGLVGANQGTVDACYAAGLVQGGSQTGGLIGSASADSFYPDGTVAGSFWDVDVSGQAASAGGTGKTTAAMQTAATFVAAGWDFVGETTNGTADIWRILEGQDYPRLSWEPMGKYGGGTGEPNDPYLIFTAAQLNAVGAEPNDWGKHFQLMADIDLSGFDGKDGRPAFNIIGTAYKNAFTGSFDGGGYTISNFTLQAGAESQGVGLFGFLGPYGVASNLAIQDANVQGDIYVGPLVGYNNGGSVRYCRATGFVRARQYTGGLIGICTGKALTQGCTAQTHVVGASETGGLVGANSSSKILQCSASGVVEGGVQTGGITGRQDIHSLIQDCYSRCTVSSSYAWASGIVGRSNDSLVSRCYTVGRIVGDVTAAPLVAVSVNGTVEACFWNVQTSGLPASGGDESKTTAEMQTARTFLDAGWDFVGETANGTEDIWWIDEGKDYPRLWWEAPAE